MILTRIFKLFFGLPPIQKRAKPNVFINNFALAAYDPANNESYILYKSFLLSLYGFFLGAFLYWLPMGLGADIPIFGLSTNEPVTRFQYDFPRYVILPLILASCIYVILLSFLNKECHLWNFSGTRPVYLKNMKNIESSRFRTAKKIFIHFIIIPFLSVAIYFLGDTVSFFNRYIIINKLNEFDAQTQTNFFIILLFYAVGCLGAVANIYAFIIMLGFEKIYSPVTKLKPLFSKKEINDDNL